MFSIGEFSKITGLTVKTLRFYHERLAPTAIDDQSGYRYYDADKVELARTIGSYANWSFRSTTSPPCCASAPTKATCAPSGAPSTPACSQSGALPANRIPS